MRKILVALVVVGFTLSCAQEEKRAKAGGGGSRKPLTEADFDRLRKINDSISDAQMAIKVAFPNSIELASNEPGLLVSEKVRDMAEKIRANCPAPNDVPLEETFEKSWVYSQTIKATGCPIEIFRRREFVASALTRGTPPRSNLWRIQSNFKVGSGDFRKLNALLTMIGGGELTYSNNGKEEKVRGAIAFKDVQVDGIGRLSINIAINSQSALVQILGSGYSYFAQMRWTGTPNSETFYLNNQLIERKTYNQMFSAYGLEELKIRSDKMREAAKP